MRIGIAATVATSTHGVDLADMISALLTQGHDVVLSGVVADSVNSSLRKGVSVVDQLTQVDCEFGILYGKDALSLTASFDRKRLIYVPDCDFDGSTEVPHLSMINAGIEFSAPHGGFYFSAFGDNLNDLTQIFRTKPTSHHPLPFDVCVVVGDNYESAVERLLEAGVESLLVVYTGCDNSACERYISSVWEKFGAIELSTFSEDPSFLHLHLAERVLVSSQIGTHIVKAILRDTRLMGVRTELIV